MQIFDLFPYFCSGLMVSFAIGALLVKNPVYSLLFLVAMVLNMAMIFMSIGSEFLGLLLVIVYAGAIAVLFLFVIMMVNYKASVVAKRPFTEGWPIVAIFVIIFIFEIVRTLFKYTDGLKDYVLIKSDYSDIKTIANLLYGTYQNELVLTAIILLIGVIGAILMTLKYVKIVPKRSFVSDQVKQTKEGSVAMINPPINSGIDY